MTNTNVDFNEVCQQLRKFKTSLVYNVIDEMFIDSQLRALSDIFIITYDTAFDLDSLAAHKQTGVDFKWKVFPMSGYLAGEQAKYSITHKSLPPVFFRFKSWRGIYDSFQHQEKGVYSQTTKDRNKALAMDVTAQSSEDMKKMMNEWAWLAEKIILIKNSGIERLEGWELAQKIGSPLTPAVKDALKMFGVSYDRFIQGFRVNNYSVERETGGTPTTI